MNIIEAGYLYASLGWKVLPVNGKVPCGGNAWQEKVTSDIAVIDTVLASCDSIGVRLGQCSGIVDVECDSEEASIELAALIGDVQTPCFRSARGIHYLFQWNENWPAPNKAVFKIGAIEFRTGNQSAAQSVFPPSGGREWLTDPATPVAVFPAMEAIHKAYSTPQKKKDLVSCYVPSGERSSQSLDVPKWLGKNGIPILSSDTEEGKQRWFIVCPNRDSHTTKDGVKDCCVMQDADGKLGGKCFHASCGLSDWNNLRDAIGGLEFSDYNVDTFDDVDITRILNQKWTTPEQEQADFEHDTDEDFCNAMVPDSGILRDVFDYYCQCAYRESHVMGLAVALSLCETIFGRRVRSHTDLRTNDYNLILATTGSGKEACETAITKILNAADPNGSHMIPPDVQSGNGLMHAVAASPCGIWVCDEFGKILQAVLDKKGNQHVKNIGKHLLLVYGKSAGQYGGAAHSDGTRNRVNQPHLVVLGLSTSSTVFDCITNENVSDGLLGRIAFWPVQDRPEPKLDMEIYDPSEELIESVRNWIEFAPGEGNLKSINPTPVTLKMSADARARWQSHASQIDEKMRGEPESRAAVWARVAARSMKLALVHRCSRLGSSPGVTSFDFCMVEIQDVNWAIKLANWLAKIACGLVRENTIDKSLSKAKAILAKAVENGPANRRDILRAFRSITAGDLEAAATEMCLVIKRDKTKGRSKVYYELPTI